MKKPAKTHKSKILDSFFFNYDQSAYEKTENRMMLAKRIKDALDKKDWNNKTFALKMKQEPSVITKWLSGTHNFTTDTLWDIEKALGICLINVTEPSQIEVIRTIEVRVQSKAQESLWNSPFNVSLLQSMQSKPKTKYIYTSK